MGSLGITNETLPIWISLAIMVAYEAWQLLRDRSPVHAPAPAPVPVLRAPLSVIASVSDADYQAALAIIRKRHADLVAASIASDLQGALRA